MMSSVAKLSKAQILNIVLGSIIVILLLNANSLFSPSQSVTYQTTIVEDPPPVEKRAPSNPIESPQSSHINEAKCSKYQNKSLVPIPDIQKRNISLLLSFPGSGNTFARLLIEAATGGLTGSIYTNDLDLMEKFEAESKCGLRMVAIKGHPPNFEVCDDALCFRNISVAESKKCRVGMIDRFNKFVFVSRHPIKSIFAEFQRIITGKHDGHVSKIDSTIVEEWKTESIRLATEISFSWENIVLPMIKRHYPIDFLVLKYENLINAEERFAELMPVPEFLKTPYEEERIDCAFYLASNISGVHRHSTIQYESLLYGHVELSCQLWALVKNYSEYFGYANPWTGIDCHPRQVAVASAKCLPYQNRAYLADSVIWNRNITLLTGFDGSGASWVRSLMEYSTGVYTGSIYSNDKDLSDIFPGESRCGLRMSAIRGFPTNFDRCGDRLCIARGRSEIAKCKRGMIPDWGRFVLVVRDPMKSMVAAFQRLVTGQRRGIIFSTNDSLLEMWAQFARDMAADYKLSWQQKLLPMSELHSRNGFHIVKYENLLSSTQRRQELQNLVTFMQYPHNTEKLDCAFELADTMADIRRVSKWTYKDLMPRDAAASAALACEIWAGIEAYSNYFKYPNPWPDLKCKKA